MAVIALVAGLLLLVFAGMMLYERLSPGAALPDVQHEPPQLPEAAPLPDVQHEPPQLPETAPLPDVQQEPPQLPETAPLPEVQPAPTPAQPQAGGNVIWRWMLYPVNAAALGIPLNPSPGYQFVALGITVENRSTENVQIDHNQFSINIDGRVYQPELISSAITFQQMPFLTSATIQSNASHSGCIGFMIPAQYRQVVAAWQHNLPPTVRVVRVDPQTARQPAQTQ